MCYVLVLIRSFFFGEPLLRILKTGSSLAEICQCGTQNSDLIQFWLLKIITFLLSPVTIYSTESFLGLPWRSGGHMRFAMGRLVAGPPAFSTEQLSKHTFFLGN